MLFLGYSGADLFLDDNRLVMRDVVETAKGFTWVRHPGSAEAAEVDRLVDVYNQQGSERASTLTITLDELLPALGSGVAGSIPREASSGKNWQSNPAVSLQPDVIDAALLLADIALHASHPALAQEALALAPDAEAVPGSVVGATMARASQQAGDHERALEQLEIPEIVSFDTIDEGLLHQLARRMAIAVDSYEAMGHIDRALYLAHAVCMAMSRLNDTRALAVSLQKYGATLCEKGLLDKSAEAIKDSMALAAELGDIQLEAGGLNELSLIDLYRGENKRSLELSTRAYKISEAVARRDGMHAAAYNMGLAHSKLDEDEKAIAWFERARDLAEE